LNLENRLKQALALYQSADLETSKQILNEIILLYPQNIDALTHLGRIAAREKSLAEACHWLGLAASLPEVSAQVHFELGCFLELQAVTKQDLELALKSYNNATELDINLHEAFFNKANIYKRLGEIEQALHAYNSAILINAYDPYYYNNRGDLLLNLRSLSYALQDFQKAIELEPSISYFHDNRGNALKELKQYEDSAVSFKRSLAIDPENALTFNNFGGLFLEREIWDKALACFEMALRLDPAFFYAYYNKGLLYQKFNLLEQALISYGKALLINPVSFDVSWNISIIQLLQGDLTTGLIGYEERMRLPENRVFLPQTTKPYLNQSLEVQRLYVWNEHGLGNEIFFANFLRHPYFASKQIIAKFDSRLHALLRHSFQTNANIRFIGERDAVNEDEYDAHIGMASLPKFLGVTVNQSHIWATPYLSLPTLIYTEAIKEKIAKTQVSSNQDKKLIVGISWKSVNPKTGARRSIPLEDIVEICKDLPIQLINLQYGDVDAELRLVISQFNPLGSQESVARGGAGEEISEDASQFISHKILQFNEIDNFADMSGLAELIKCCDLVISVDNSTLHLSSALGKPTCALISFVPDWRWFLERIDSPWYKNAKLYRQVKSGGWTKPLELLRADLERVVSTL